GRGWSPRRRSGDAEIDRFNMDIGFRGIMMPPRGIRSGQPCGRRGEMKSYDYVIVGAGSAGCVLAARLSEDQDTSVLLIEAGPPDDKENIQVPAAFGALLKTDIDWEYGTIDRE